VFILKDKASERFKNKTAEFLSSFYPQISDKLKGWDGDLDIFNKIVPSLLERHYHFYYREKFKINPVKNISRINKEEELNKMEKRLLNVIISMIKDQQAFYLEDAVKMVHEKNQDKVIEALEMLIDKQIIVSAIEQNRI
jgi:hypothetical protein